MNLTIKVSEDPYRRAAEVAAEENLSVEELFRRGLPRADR
jgi:hypothetical protein